MPNAEEMPEWSDLIDRLRLEVPELFGGRLITPDGELELDPDPFASPPAEQLVEGGAVVNLPWEFCVSYNGRQRGTQIIYAPSPESAARTAEQWLFLLNNVWAPSQGYPPLFTITGGRCNL